MPCSSRRRVRPLAALALLPAVLLGIAAPGDAATPAGSAAAGHYLVRAGGDPLVPEGEKPKVVITVTAAVPGRRYFLRLTRTTKFRQPATGAECQDSALPAVGLTASARGSVVFRPQPGGPYVFGPASMCAGIYNGAILEQRAGHGGSTLVRRFRLGVPSFTVTVRPT